MSVSVLAMLLIATVYDCVETACVDEVTVIEAFTVGAEESFSRRTNQ